MSDDYQPGVAVVRDRLTDQIATFDGIEWSSQADWLQKALNRWLQLYEAPLYTPNPSAHCARQAVIDLPQLEIVSIPDDDEIDPAVEY